MMTSSAPERRPGSSTPPSSAKRVPGLLPHSTLACQVQATNAWRRDLDALLRNASERFADVCWTFGEGNDTNHELEDEFSRPESSLGSHDDHLAETRTIWAHKAILYARSSNAFQARYLQLRSPAANLGAMANCSTVSLPGVRAVSPDSVRLSVPSSSIRSVASRQRPSVRGQAPPSSFVAPRGLASNSDTEGEDTTRMLRTYSNNSMSKASIIHRPQSRTSRGYSPQPPRDDSDTFSVISAASTMRAPMNLPDVSSDFFQSTLEYLYTAEDSAVDVFEFLFEDRIGPNDGTEKRLDKLRQDMVFMWRSRLYSDIDIVLGEDVVRTIPDANASVLSLALDERTEEEETASFSAHRMILASRSPYYASLLLSPYADTNSRVVRLPSPPFTPAAMHFTLGFMYTGTLFFSNRTFDISTAFQIWLAGSYLQIETLQTLISSLIAQDFCHAFACSPPCKTCVKRVPRVLTFVSRPDVSDVRLRALAQNAISGDHFGAYWSKEIGNLEYAMRGSIVSDVCTKIDQSPGFVLIALRQLAIVGSRIDIERSSHWVDSLRWMCESVQAHISANISSKLDSVVASAEWYSVVQGVGFLNDILEKVLTILLDNLEESMAAKNYEVLVGNVLLHDDLRPAQHVVEVVEEARHAIIQYVRKRWVNIRTAGGFNDLKTWALKELADEIDVPAADLLLSDDAASDVARRNARSYSSSSATTPPSSPAALWSSSKRQRSPVPGSIVDGQREAGPINLRAAVLNRNAARVSSSSTVRSASQSSSRQSERSMQRRPAEVEPAAAQIFDSPASNRRAERSDSASASSIIVYQTSPESTSRATSTTTTPAAARQASVAARVARSSVGKPLISATQPTGQTATSMPLMRRQQQGVLPPRHGSPAATGTSGAVAAAIAKFSNNSTNSVASKKHSFDRRRQPSTASNASLEGSSTASSTKAPPLSRSTRTQEAAGSRDSANTGQAALAKAKYESAAPNANSRSLPKAGPLTDAMRRQTSKTLLPGAPTAAAAAAAAASRTSKSLRGQTASVLSPVQPNLPRDELREHDPFLVSTMGKSTRHSNVVPSNFATKLSLGIPCVIAPTMRNGKPTRFRATVKYIGPLHTDASASTIVGVEITMPLPPGLDEALFDFHDGVYDGQEYFRIGLPDYTAADTTELHHKPEREARRQRIEEMLRGHDGLRSRSSSPMAPDEISQATITSVSVNLDGVEWPSAKRRKELSGHRRGLTGTDASAASAAGASPTTTRGLFIQPHEVLWVVI